jgi:hypothetical protein
MAIQVNAYPCHYCGTYSEPHKDCDGQLPSEYDGKLYGIFICKRPICQALYKKETNPHSLNNEGLATVIHRYAE